MTTQATQKTTGKWKGWLVGCLFILLIWYASDLITLGRTLNTLTPWGDLLGVGTVLWVIILLIICCIFIRPILQFIRLKTVSPEASYAAAIKDLKPYHDGKKTGEDQRNLFVEMTKPHLSPDKKRELMLKYLEIGDTPRAARELIWHSSLATGTLVAFSRKRSTDAIIMLVMQTWMVAEIARMYGYKPSPVFNVCCFAWVCANSLLAKYLQNAADAFGDTTTEFISGLIGDMSTELVSSSIEEHTMEAGAETAMGAISDVFNSLTFGLASTILKAPAELAGFLARMAFEAAFSGGIVYATGRLFLYQLEHVQENGKKLVSLLKMRREGRRKLYMNLIKLCIPSKEVAEESVNKDLGNELSSIKKSINQQRDDLEAQSNAAQ